MSNKHLSKTESVLPTRYKNLIRGSRFIGAAVSELRKSIELDLFPALINTLPLFPQRGYSLLPSVGVSIESFRNDVPLFTPISLR